MAHTSKLIIPVKDADGCHGIKLQLEQTDRVYFLAGPIRGAPDWQAKAIAMIYEQDPDAYIVCPRRYDEHQQLFFHSLYHHTTGYEKITFPSQTMWERYYLELASWYGCIIFWLPCEDPNNPRKKEDGPYARDTYGELGRWSIRSAYIRLFSLFLIEEDCGFPHVNVCVGAEDNFPGLDVIRKNFDDDYHQGQFASHTGTVNRNNRTVINYGTGFWIEHKLEEVISSAIYTAKLKL